MASGTEIRQYIKDVATKLDLEKYMKFNHKVLEATWNEPEGRWDLLSRIATALHQKLGTDSGLQLRMTASRSQITATFWLGQQELKSPWLFAIHEESSSLTHTSTPLEPDTPNLHSFKGPVVHTGNWCVRTSNHLTYETLRQYIK
jgi:hypothetical protein